MPVTITRARVFAGCALVALAIGGDAAVLPSPALAQAAGRVAAAPDATPAAAQDTTRRAVSQDAPRIAVQEPPPVATPTAPRAATLRPVAQQFLATVRANFAQWDLNHDGRLTREEIELDMQNPRFTGDAAAALASLKIGATKSNHLPETRSFSTADIDAIERTLEAGQKLDANFIGYFAAGRKKLEETPRELFAQGTPRLTAIRQMFTSDCYFLSAAGAVAQTNPLALVRLITPNRDGSYTVQFAGQPPVRILRPTDTEIATYTTAKDGIWLNVLQKAYAVLRIRMEPKEPATREALDSVGFRTGSTGVVELLTGHPSRAIRLGGESEQPGSTHAGAPTITPAGAPPSARMLAQVRAALQVAFRDRRAVLASKTHHAYAITGYDAATDQVTVHNPYNHGGLETLAEGSKVPRTEDGFFTISTAQLVTYFFNVRFEQGGRAGS